MTPDPTLHDMLTSGGQPHEMTHQQVGALRDRLNNDLFLFAWTIFDYHDLNLQLHGEICQLLQRWGSPDLRRLIVQIPRGHLKTSLCTIANSLWQVCKDPNAPIAIFNEKEDNAAMWVRAIREVVMSSHIFQTLYYDLLPPGIHRTDTGSMPRWWKWSDTELLFQRSKVGIPEPSITALGIGSASAGRHWPKIIKDDLISEDAKNSNSVMERARDWLDNSFALEKPAIGGQDLIACTPWSYDDIYSYALKKYDYKLYRRSAIESGRAIFPEKFDKQQLREMRRRDPYHFSSQFMCKPRPGREQAFEYGWLRWGSILPDGFTFNIEPKSFDPSLNPAEVPEPPQQRIPLSAMEKAILVDPAPTEESDKKRERYARTAILVEGIDFWGRRYVLDCWADRVAPPEVLETIFQLMDKWGADTVAIEKVTFSVIYKHWLQDMARQRGIWVRTVDLEPGKRSKDARINEKITPFRLGHYYLNRPIEELFVQEYLEYPYGNTRDILDALAYDNDDGVLMRPPSPEERALYEEGQINWQSGYEGIDPVTNY